MIIDKDQIFEVGEYSYKNFIHLTTEEKNNVLLWRNNAVIRRFMYNSDEITIENHYQFLDSLIDRDDCCYWLVFKKSIPMGVMYLTCIVKKESCAELGYYLIPDVFASGRGLDFVYTNFLFAFNYVLCTKMMGNVHFENRNALYINKYLGSKIIGNKIILINGHSITFTTWEISKEDFLENHSSKNQIRNFVQYCKNNQID
jgi:UDP-4-amino-4,6-dideoxy-N-acetyl-beta-L-altrosamine N-acetyltransferase